MMNDRFELAEGIALLERTPGTLRALLSGLSPSWVHAKEGEETWSPHTVLIHLCHGERTAWMPRVRTILEHGAERPFETFDRTKEFEASGAKSLDALLDEFAAERRASLESLRALKLSDEQLELVGAHPAFGRVTLRQLLATWTVHDLSHLVQISRTMAKRYREAVGPWREYLSVMDR